MYSPQRTPNVGDVHCKYPTSHSHKMIVPGLLYLCGLAGRVARCVLRFKSCMIVAWELPGATACASICQAPHGLPHRDDILQSCSYVFDGRVTCHWNFLKVSTDVGFVIRMSGAEDW